MTLTNPTVVTTEPIPAKEFPHLWLYNILVHSPSTTTGRILIETLPYNGDTKEIGNGIHRETIQTDKLWEAVNEVPEVAQAMLAIFQALEPLRTWIDAQNVVPAAPEVTEEIVTDPSPVIIEEIVTETETETQTEI